VKASTAGTKQTLTYIQDYVYSLSIVTKQTLYEHYILTGHKNVYNYHIETSCSINNT